MRRAGAALIALLAVAGCGSTQPAAGPAPAAHARLAAAIFHDSRYEADGDALYHARERLIGRCMAREGFDYDGGADALPPPPQASLPRAGAGYGLQARLAGVPRAALVAARRHARPKRPAPGFQRALSGAGPPRTVRVAGAPPLSYQAGGCAARATQRVYGDLAGYYGRLTRQNVAAMDVNARMEADARLKRARRAWQRCMNGRYRSPDGARATLYEAYIRGAHGVHRRELRTAAADRACGLQSGLYAQEQRSRRVALAALPAEKARWALEFASRRAQAADRARALLKR
jgi:hypothetical protein